MFYTVKSFQSPDETFMPVITVKKKMSDWSRAELGTNKAEETEETERRELDLAGDVGEGPGEERGEERGVCVIVIAVGWPLPAGVRAKLFITGGANYRLIMSGPSCSITLTSHHSTLN